MDQRTPELRHLALD